jgi:peptidyl-prolyl cis-trans isomerase SurA
MTLLLKIMINAKMLLAAYFLFGIYVQAQTLPVEEIQTSTPVMFNEGDSASKKEASAINHALIDAESPEATSAIESTAVDSAQNESTHPVSSSNVPQDASKILAEPPGRPIPVELVSAPVHEHIPMGNDLREAEFNGEAAFIPEILPETDEIPVEAAPPISLAKPEKIKAPALNIPKAKSTQDSSQWNVEFAAGIVAVVNDHIITADDLKHEIAPTLPTIRRDSVSQQDFNRRVESVARETAQGMVDNILIIEEAKKLGLKIPDFYIENEYQDFLTKQFNGDRTRYQEFLKAQGKTDRQFRKELEEQIITSYMRNMKRKSQASVSPEKIEKYYEKHKKEFYQDAAVHLWQIMLNPGQEALATDIINQLNAGAKFEDMAKKYSQDDKKEEGGDWGWIDRKEIRSELANVAFKLAPKTYAHEPVNLNGTLFILYVEEKRSAGIEPIDKVRGRIEIILANQIAQQSQQYWLEGLRRQAYIRYYL